MIERMNATLQSQPAARDVCYDVPRLVQMFESLGENCDLGVVQRAVGLEPFGLFRFSACNAAVVAELLRDRFEKLFDADDLWLDVVGERREYWVKSRNTHFEAHTNRFADQHQEEVVRRGELDRMRYLKAHLLKDLTRGKKLFVYKGQSDLATLRSVAEALQLYGKNTLLWIDLAHPGRPPTDVQRDSEHLLTGSLSRFGLYDDGPSLPIDEWVRLCGQAYRLWKNEEPPQASLENLLTPGLEWRADPGAATQVVQQPSPAPGLVFEHEFLTTEATPVCSCYLPVTRGGPFALSAWVRLTPAFEPKNLSVVFAGLPSVTTWMADPKTQDRWQRIWVSATLPEDARGIACALFGQGAPGGRFQSAAWCLERGTRPSGYGFTL
jgi:hypothetical protein